ncbi:hypothetical protein [Nocardioides sp.]|uniref:hypothetical protein n=1 Tax=Nocardioides sp. TaxID=35761 RepID=UPI003527F5EB
MSSFDRLDSEPVLATVERLEQRVAARFPERGLRRVAGDLAVLAADVADGTGTIRGRLRLVRVVERALTVLVVVGTTAVLAFAFHDPGSVTRNGSAEWVGLIESTINDLVFAAIAIFFLHALPARLERGHLLGLLHRLRSVAHVIDMHQLTKDPERLRPDFVRTSESVEPALDRSQMEHYLDYCSELLSLVGKVAALCAEESRDPLVLETVSDIETLTTSMSRKIWQKISLLPD